MKNDKYEWCGYYTWDNGRRTTRYSQGAREAYRAGLTTYNIAHKRLKRLTGWEDEEIDRHFDCMGTEGRLEFHHYGPDAHWVCFVCLKQTKEIIQYLKKNKIPVLPEYVKKLEDIWLYANAEETFTELMDQYTRLHYGPV